MTECHKKGSSENWDEAIKLANQMVEAHYPSHREFKVAAAFLEANCRISDRALEREDLVRQLDAAGGMAELKRLRIEELERDWKELRDESIRQDYQLTKLTAYAEHIAGLLGRALPFIRSACDRGDEAAAKLEQKIVAIPKQPHQTWTCRKCGQDVPEEAALGRVEHVCPAKTETPRQGHSETKVRVAYEASAQACDRARKIALCANTPTGEAIADVLEAVAGDIRALKPPLSPGPSAPCPLCNDTGWVGDPNDLKGPCGMCLKFAEQGPGVGGSV